TTESIKQSENLYNTKHTIYGDKNTFFITNCRGQKGKVFNDVICSSINEEVCSAYKKLKGFDRDLFAKVNSCIDIEKKVDAFKNTYKKVIEQDEFKKKHQIGKEEGRIALNKYANVLSLTDVFDKNTGNHMNQEGILEASWNEVNTLVKNCPGIRDDDYYSLNELSVSVESQPHTVKPRKTNTGKK
ncbi:MAG: hypothetical protein KDD37_02735, partial [Bdellovibrionales bacterium]|nr:hypothetical protein [Bdellovibrionales bacterium]